MNGRTGIGANFADVRTEILFLSQPEKTIHAIRTTEIALSKKKFLVCILFMVRIKFEDPTAVK